jgi:hypothetical protein
MKFIKKNIILLLVLIIIIIFVIYKYIYIYKENNTIVKNRNYTQRKNGKNKLVWTKFNILTSRYPYMYIRDMNPTSTTITTTTTTNTGFMGMSDTIISNINPNINVDILANNTETSKWYFDYWPAGQTTCTIRNSHTMKYLCYELFPDNITYLVTRDHAAINTTTRYLWRLFISDSEYNQNVSLITIKTYDNKNITQSGNYLITTNSEVPMIFYVKRDDYTEN